MHGFEPTPGEQPAVSNNTPWYKDLNRYQWFVLAVAALGWLFDTMDQQLFTLARAPAMAALKAPAWGSTVSTSIFLIGWATGGLFFGVMGDRYGRAKVMLWTILIYSIFTGLSALSFSVYDFALYRFLTGLGVGGEFAVGVSLVAEVMPSRARPFALGLLQALSAVGNITAALIAMTFAQLEADGRIGQGESWRWMFVVGTAPALLAILIRRRLKEPEQWKAISTAQAKKQLGSYGELFSHPRWRKNALLGMTLAFSGVVGLWGIGFFSVDLNREVFTRKFVAEFREQGEPELDEEFVRSVVLFPQEYDELVKAGADAVPKQEVLPNHLITRSPENTDARVILTVVNELRKKPEQITPRAILLYLDEEDKKLENPDRGKLREIRDRRSKLLAPRTTSPSESNTVEAHFQRILERTRLLSGKLGFWTAVTSVMINIGAFFGIYGFTYLTHYLGRRPAFAIAYVAAGISTAWVFWSMNDFSDLYYKVPIMGFCQLALFGGFAIYFPELFPTHLRSTGTSFCYNVGRFVAALGPLLMGYLKESVFTAANGFGTEGFRYAGVSMCSIFLIGLLALPFVPETKGQPIPE